MLQIKLERIIYFQYIYIYIYIFFFFFFFENSAAYEIMWENLVEQEGPQVTIEYDSYALHAG
jgi:hypothetical protein